MIMYNSAAQHLVWFNIISLSVVLNVQYKDVVVFADRKDLVVTVSKYLFDDEARRAMERKALQFALDMQQDLEHLENALVGILHDMYFDDA